MVISGLELSALENGGVTAVTTVTATLAHNGTFHCLVHNEYGGYDVASTSVVVYGKRLLRGSSCSSSVWVETRPAWV